MYQRVKVKLIPLVSECRVLFWGPAAAEKEIEQRPNQCFVLFAADKTDRGAYNHPLYLAFADPMYCAGLILSPKMDRGLKFMIMDVEHSQGDGVMELSAPVDAYDIASISRDNQRFVIEHIYCNTTGEIAASVSTTRLHNIAGKYTGKDDPIALVRVHGEPTESGDAFDQAFWDRVRDQVSQESLDIRRQGFSGAAVLPYKELEYGGIVEKMKKPDNQLRIGECGHSPDSHVALSRIGAAP